MTLEELKALMKETVQAELAPVLETQRKYAHMLDGGAAANQPPAPTKGLEPGIRLARFAKVMALAKNDVERAAKIAKTMYDDAVLIKALGEGTPSDGGYLVPEEFGQEIIPLLQAQAVIRKIGARMVPMSSNVMNMPRQTAASMASYIGENTNIQVSQPAFGNLKLSAKKLAALVPISNDLIRDASTQADQFVRDDIITALALKGDWAAMYGTGTGDEPLGLKNTPDVEMRSVGAAVDGDVLASVIGSIMQANVAFLRPGWIFNGIMWSKIYNLKTTTGQYLFRDEMNQGKLLGYPYQVSNQIPVSADTNKTTDIFFGDWAEFMIGENMRIAVDASTEAAYVVGGNLVSAYSLDQTIIRAIERHDFGARQPKAFIVLTDVYTA